MEKISAHPVKHRHEVVADDLHPVLAQIAQTFLIILNVLLALRRAELDRLVHVDTLDDINIEAVLRRLRLDRSDARLRPDLARREVMQRPNDAAHARNLADLFEGDGVIAFAIPAKSGFHVFSSLTLKNDGSSPCQRSDEPKQRTARVKQGTLVNHSDDILPSIAA